MAYDWKCWSYLYHDKKPIGRERKYCLVGEFYSMPEVQDTRNRSCFFKKDQVKIGQLQTDFPIDKLGRKIFYNVDRVIILMANHEPLLVWKPLYRKGTRIVLECIIPGYTQYRCLKKASDLLVISDQIMANEVRDHEQYEFVAVSKNKTGFALKE